MSAPTVESAQARHQADSVSARTPRGIAPAVWAVTRIALGFIFLWAFLDKTFGLGFSTPSERSLLNGGDPTAGFLQHVEGPFSGLFNALAGQTVVNLLFMLGLLGVGVAVILGIGMRVAAGSGALMMIFMWMASLPLSSNPVLDDHIIYALVLIGLAASNAGDTFGLGRLWSRTALVRSLPWLR